jgi:tetratricopeptide (TPR) repeat protein
MRKSLCLAAAVLLCVAGLGAAQTAAKPGTGKSPAVPLEDHLRIRLQVHPQDEAAHKQLVNLLSDKYAFRALVVEDANWIRNNPSDYFALTELVSHAQVDLDDPEFAIAQQRSFLAHTSREADDFQYDVTMSSLAANLNKRGRSQEALTLLDQLVRLNPQDAGLWWGRSVPLISLGRLAEAAQSLHRCLDLDASQEGTHEDLADVLMKSGDAREAEVEYRAALSVYDAKYKKGESTSFLDSLNKGLVKLEAANQEEHSLAETHLKLARVLMLQREWDAALAETRAALDADKTAFGSLYLQAQIYDAAGDHGRAEEARRTASAAIEKLMEKERGRSQAGGIDGDPRLLLLSSELDFSVPAVHDSDGLPVLFASEIVMIAEPKVSRLSPMDRFILAEAYFCLGRVQDGKDQSEKAIASDSTFDTAKAHARLGQRLLKSGSLADAVQHLRRAYELDPQNMTYRIDYEAAKQALAEKRSAS